MLDLVFPERVRVKETECSESGWGTVFGYDHSLQRWVIRLDNDVKLSDEFLYDYVTHLLLFSEDEIIEIESEWTVKDSAIAKEYYDWRIS